MYEWQNKLQVIINEIDVCIKKNDDEALSLSYLADKLGYSEFYFSRKFRELSGMQFRDYLRYRKLAFALRELADKRERILDIALRYGFSSQEAFTRSFREAYGITPGEYRRNPGPVALRTIIKPFDCYLLGTGEFDMGKAVNDVKIYFVTIPEHKFLYIKNYESMGYWDFWQKQSRIPGQDCKTICGLLDGIKGKLDDMGGDEANGGSGQLMAFMNEPAGRICSWGIPLAECYGVRLPADYSGDIPSQMLLSDVPEAEYIVFEHGPFDYEKENGGVEEKIEMAMKTFDYAAAGCCLDTTPGRMFYFYHDPERFWKYVRPIRRV